MSDEAMLRWFPYAFPFFFAGMWLAVTAMLGVMSGWFNLQQWYADEIGDEPLLKLGWQSGSMGFGVNFNGCLTLAACRSGLSIRVWRIFGPFQRPLLIPWNEIEATPRQMFFMPMVRLEFGRPANGKLTINARSWSKLVAAVPQTGAGRQFQFPTVPAISAASMARGLFLGWLAMTSLGAAFFYFGPRTLGGPGLPLAECITLPAIVFGIAALIQFARQG